MIDLEALQDISDLPDLNDHQCYYIGMHKDKYCLYIRDTSEASCGENRANYIFLKVIEEDRAAALVATGLATVNGSSMEDKLIAHWDHLVGKKWRQTPKKSKLIIEREVVWGHKDADAGRWIFQLWQESIDEKTTTYEHLRDIEINEVTAMLSMGLAENRTGLNFGKDIPKPRVKVKAGSRRI